MLKLTPFHQFEYKRQIQKYINSQGQGHFQQMTLGQYTMNCWRFIVYMPVQYFYRTLTLITNHGHNFRRYSTKNDVANINGHNVVI